jgi:hypothetical protein
MAEQICFNRDTFYSYIILALGVIAFVIYKIYTDKKNEAITQKPPSEPVNITSTITDAIKHMMVASTVQRNEDLNRLVNPMIPPLRRGPFNYTGATPEFPVNMPTRGEYGPFQTMGYLFNSTNPDQAMPLMGRKIHSNQYEYYTFHHNNPNIKIPIKIKGDREIDDEEAVQVPIYPNQTFTAKVYDIDHPRYIPY